MDLVNQYLRAVAALLPRSQRDDIAAELRDIILSRIEAREAALGHRLTDNEIEEELRIVGHPILVAARYREEPQHLVGPSLYPYWMFGVKIAIAIQVIAALAALIVRTLSGQDFGHALGQAIGQAVAGSITLIGVATVAAWLIERRKIHVNYLDNWRVRDLHVLEYAGWDFSDLRDYFHQGQPTRVAAVGKVRRHRRSPISQAIFQVAFGTVFILWWVGAIHLPFFDHATDPRLLHIDFTMAGMNLGDLHGLVFWPVLLYSTAIIIQGALTLVYPGVRRLRGLIAILMSAALLAFCVWLWTVSPIASAIRVDSLAELFLKLKQDFRDSPPLMFAPIMTLCLGGLAFAAVIDIVSEFWKLLIPSRQEDRA